MTDDEECTRCGVRQDWLGPCDDCAIKDGDPVTCPDCGQGRPGPGLVHQCQADSPLHGHQWGLRSNVDTNAIADALPGPCERHPGASTIGGLCALCFCGLPPGHGHPSEPPPGEVTIHPRQAILSPGGVHCYGCGVSIGGGTDADRMDWFTNHPCPGRTTSKKETGVLATVRRASYGVGERIGYRLGRAWCWLIHGDDGGH